MVALTSIVPTSNGSIIRCADLDYGGVTMTLLSGLKQTELTLEVCPVYFRIYLADMTSVSMIFLSPPPLINLELSLLMSIEYTS